MNVKKILALVLAVGLLFTLAACSGQATPTATPIPAATAAPSATVEPSVPPTEITAFMLVFGTITDWDKVMDEVNKVTLEESNTTAKITTVNLSAYKEQVNLWLAANEPYDLFLTGTNTMCCDYPNQLAKGYLKPIRALLDEYGPDIKEVLGDYVEAAKGSDGDIYGVTTMRDLATSSGVQLRKDLVEKYNIDTAAIKTDSDLEPYFEEVKAGESGMTMIFGSRGSPIAASLDSAYATRDALGGADAIGLLDPTNSTQISIFVESDKYMEACKLARNWYEKGYTVKDAATTTTTGEDLMKAGTLFSLITSMKAGQASQILTSTGKEVIDVQTSSSYANTNTVISFIWAVPIYSENPEAAIKWLNEMYGNEKVVNTLCWGIEGTHWEKKSDGFIDYPAGVTAQTTGYSAGINWLAGDQFKSYLWVGSDPNVWKDQANMNTNAAKSLALGFIFDTTSVKTEYASLVGAVNEFSRAIEFGTVDPEKSIPEYVAKLKNVGAEKVMAEKQKQLDAWLAAQK